MSDIAPTTDGQAPVGTDGTPPAATPPTGEPAATEGNTIPEGFELIRTEDKNNLVSARDRANNLSSESEGYVATLAKREGIDGFLSEHKTDYPDVTRDDLMHLDDPEALEAEAKRIQRRYEDVVQKKLLDVQRADTPVLSPEERTAELKRLKDNPGSGSFQRMLDLQRPA